MDGEGKQRVDAGHEEKIEDDAYLDNTGI